MTPPRIGFDARFLDFPGVGRYSATLLEGLSRHADRAHVVAYLRPGQAAPRGVQETRVVADPPFSIAMQLKWRRQLAADRIDLFHSPHFEIPLLAPCPVVVTLHDMVYFRYPPENTRERVRLAYYRLMNEAVARRANGFITASMHARSEIAALLPIPESRIALVAHAIDVDRMRVNPEVVEQVRSRLGLPAAFALYIGTNKPWKNVETIMRAATLLHESVPGFRLVIAGKQGKNETSIESLAVQLGCGESVVLLGAVDEADMAPLYHAATMVLCPSSYEGFGLTALEAMASETPVVASTAASLPEVVGSAGELVPPFDVTAWTRVISELWSDDARRARMSRNGLAQARTFSIERLALGTLAVYDETLAAS